MLLMNSKVFITRAFSSGTVDSVSSCFGIATPANRAAAPLAVSQAIWICADRGSMSTMRRAAGIAFGTTFFASAWLDVLSRRGAILFRLKIKIGIDTSYVGIDMRNPVG